MRGEGEGTGGEGVRVKVIRTQEVGVRIETPRVEGEVGEICHLREVSEGWKRNSREVRYKTRD